MVAKEAIEHTFISAAARSSAKSSATPTESVMSAILPPISFARLSQKLADLQKEQELIDQAGEIAREHMPQDYPHTLTHCIGQPEGLVVDETEHQLNKDRLLLCSDGLNKVVDPWEIVELLSQNCDPQRICSSLIDRANSLLGPDNITAIALFVD